MNIQKLIGLTAFLLLALSMFAQTEAFSDWGNKKFHQTGPRYGRGGRSGAKKISAMRTMVAPRIERFELGTRYGKRSNIGEIAETLIYPVAAASSAPKTVLCGQDDELVCTHTGMANIYRCNQSYESDAAKDEPQAEMKD